MSLVNMQGKFMVKASGVGGGGGISAPSNVAISNKSSSGFTVSWNAVASALGYKLDVATDSGFTSFVSGYNGKDVAGTSEAVTGLASNTTYYTRVRAVAASSNSGVVSDSTEAVSATTFSSLGNGLQAFYKLDDTTDVSGNGRTLTNNNSVTFSSGKIGNAASFNGSNYLISNSQTGVNLNEISLAAWVYPTRNDQNLVILCQNFDDQAPWFLHPYNGQLQLVGGGGNSYLFGFEDPSNNSYVPSNQWSHVCCTYNNTTKTWKAYVNGTNTATITNMSWPSIASFTGVSVGWHPSNIKFEGQLDAVGVWGRALTSGEIAELYSQGNGKEVSGLLNGLQAFYKLDDTTDASGNGNTLTNNGSVTFSSGKIGNAATLNGSNYLSVAGTSPFGSNDFSVGGWVNAANLDNSQKMFFIGGNGGFGISLLENTIHLAKPGVADLYDFTSVSSVTNNSYFHLVVTRSANIFTAYVNGSYIGTYDAGSTVNFTGTDIYLGAYIGGGYNLQGQIDAVGIWNRALNGTEVSELYNSGSGLE